MTPMDFALGLALQTFLGALLLWLSIKILDRHNFRNSFPAAVGWSLVIACAGIVPIIGLVFGLVVFFTACLRYYELGVLQSLGVFVLDIALALGVGFLLVGLGVIAR